MSIPPDVRGRYAPGDRIGDRYALERLVARGGMGMVWAGVQLDLALQVAVKIVSGDSAHWALADRLLREAQVAAQVRHPGLVRSFDYGTTCHGDPYIVLEWLEGETLGEVHDSRGPLPPETVARIFLPLASAIDALHEQRIVHRDIKPDNIVLTQDATGAVCPKLVDFGIARTEAARGKYVPETPEAGIVGTPGYAAPEQILGGEISDRTDVWGFSVTMVEAMTGEHLFHGDGLAPIVAASAEVESIELGERYPDLPARLRDALSRGLAMRAAERVSIRWLRGELAAWLQERGVTTDISGMSIEHYLEPDRQTAIEVEERDTPQPISRSFAPASSPRGNRKRTAVVVVAALAAAGATTGLWLDPELARSKASPALQAAHARPALPFAHDLAHPLPPPAAVESTTSEEAEAEPGLVVLPRARASRHYDPAGI